MPIPITPGSAPQFTVTPIPAGVVTFAALTKWIISADTHNTVPGDYSTTMSDDGLTVTVHVPASAPIGSGFQLTWRYASPNKTVMEVQTHLIIVA